MSDEWEDRLTALAERQREAKAAGWAAFQAGELVIWVHGAPYVDPEYDSSAPVKTGGDQQAMAGEAPRADAGKADSGIEHQQEPDQLGAMLERMVQVDRQHGKVIFETEADAARFVADLKARYGDKVVHRIAAGETQVLAAGFPEVGERREIAQAIITAANSHESFGLGPVEAALARRYLQKQHEPEHARREPEHDLEL